MAAAGRIGVHPVDDGARRRGRVRAARSGRDDEVAAGLYGHAGLERVRREAAEVLVVDHLDDVVLVAADGDFEVRVVLRVVEDARDLALDVAALPELVAGGALPVQDLLVIDLERFAVGRADRYAAECERRLRERERKTEPQEPQAERTAQLHRVSP
jgi:hypothetical protein